MNTKKKKLVLATQNKNKVIEINNLLENTDIKLISVVGKFDPEENGQTFEENAYIKAFAAAKTMQSPALADDSGLVIDALDGKPGIYSSRYAENDEKRIERVLSELNDIDTDKKTARFMCAMVIVSPDGELLHSCIKSCEGIISDTPTGIQGFGYDPIFYIPELKQTMAQLSLEEKNKISHRAQALNCMISWIKDNL